MFVSFLFFAVDVVTSTPLRVTQRCHIQFSHLCQVCLDIICRACSMLRGYATARESVNERRMADIFTAVRDTPTAVPVWQPPPDVRAIVVTPEGGIATWADVERLSRYAILFDVPCPSYS